MFKDHMNEATSPMVSDIKKLIVKYTKVSPEVKKLGLKLDEYDSTVTVSYAYPPQRELTKWGKESLKHVEDYSKMFEMSESEFTKFCNSVVKNAKELEYFFGKDYYLAEQLAEFIKKNG